MEFDFQTNDYYLGYCVHRQKIPIFSTIRVKKGGAPDLRCKAGAQGCGRSLLEPKKIRPVRRSA